MSLPSTRIFDPFSFDNLGKAIFKGFFTEDFPRVDISEKDCEITVRAELPGMSKDDISVEVSDFVLEIKGERKDETVEEGETLYVKEITSGSFSRSFKLPSCIDPEKIEASFQDGILTINIPKIDEEDKPFKVNVK